MLELIISLLIYLETIFSSYYIYQGADKNLRRSGSNRLVEMPCSLLSDQKDTRSRGRSVGAQDYRPRNLHREKS